MKEKHYSFLIAVITVFAFVLAGVVISLIYLQQKPAIQKCEEINTNVTEEYYNLGYDNTYIKSISDIRLDRGDVYILNIRKLSRYPLMSLIYSLNLRGKCYIKIELDPIRPHKKIILDEFQISNDIDAGFGGVEEGLFTITIISLSDVAIESFYYKFIEQGI